ncbi:MmgE/PrpD family protein [Actinokineospora sp. UTMC 2448]|uniref:MmgE/PrpD family protein n=1 Tax=Actinokineospora sp. UTMC 2448 TaxID=2268449 RepID=UPI00216431C9|nr:MmgE/PrpD family protein [Actinokineospora sp. UTMC 2448]UVS82013.1 MmgE/PrpD family protein [Actinokineospora sp. UTMC 2448]
MTRLRALAGWAAGVRPEDIPTRVREYAASQVLSQVAAIRAGARHPTAARLTAAFGGPTQPDRKAAACVLAALGSWLNLDDTAYAGHLSNSTVAVPLAYARDGADLITAVVVANECAARITAAATLGPLRGQSAMHTHLAGAVAGRLTTEDADAERWTDALALAFAMPNWPLLRAFLASDARLLCTMVPVRTALDACDAAHAGLTGAHDLMEHPDGFLARFAEVPLPGQIDHALGEQWHTETLSFKLHPGGPGIDAAVDAAAELAPLADNDIAEVTVEASAYTLMAQHTADRYADGPDTPLGALVLDVAYPVATALLTGHLTAADLERPATEDPARWSLAKKVRLREDKAMTRELLASDAPFGAALRMAGRDAEPWLRRFGLTAPEGGQRDFRHATKATPARVTVRLHTGETLTSERAIPRGAAGPETRAEHRSLIRAKFRESGGSAESADVELESLTGAGLRSWLRAALS